MRYDSKRSALLYFKKWLQLNKQIKSRTIQIEEGSCLTTGALKNMECTNIFSLVFYLPGCVSLCLTSCYSASCHALVCTLSTLIVVFKAPVVKQEPSSI